MQGMQILQIAQNQSLPENQDYSGQGSDAWRYLKVHL